MVCFNSKEFLIYQDDIGNFPESTNECEDLRTIVYCRYGCFRRCNRVVITVALPNVRSAISVTSLFNFKSLLVFLALQPIVVVFSQPGSGL